MEVQTLQPLSPAAIDEPGFERLFKTHFRRLFAYALTILKDEVSAEEIVQNVFFKVWEKKETLQVHTSMLAYLYRAVYNESLNHLKHDKVKASYKAHIDSLSKNGAYTEAPVVSLSELQLKVDIALQELPEQCRTIFQMSRFEELKYHEIASELGISVKTVENQISKALKLLRVKLADYLPIILPLLIQTLNRY